MTLHKCQGHGNVMAMSWQCHGNVMAMSWQCHGNVMAMSWQCQFVNCQAVKHSISLQSQGSFNNVQC